MAASGSNESLLQARLDQVHIRRPIAFFRIGLHMVQGLGFSIKRSRL